VKKAMKKLKNINPKGKYYTQGLQDFKPEIKYDCIWLQWVIENLMNKDLIELLRILGNSLQPEGILVIKENV